MKLGSILAGAFIGVGAIAAAPFTGGGSLLAGASLAGSLAGAGTVAAAAGAAGAGALAGAAISEIEEDDHRSEVRKAKKTGFNDGLIKGQEEITQKFSEILLDIKARDEFLLGLTAFCYAAANCDGTISEEENDELDHYLNYIKTNGALRPAIKGQLTKIKNRKDEFEKITKKLDKISFENLNVFHDILNNIVEADDHLSPEEVLFKNKWEEYYETRRS